MPISRLDRRTLYVDTVHLDTYTFSHSATDSHSRTKPQGDASVQVV